MQISAPIYKLKRRAKLLARKETMPLHEALDRVAQKEGFQSWSHLSSVKPKSSPAAIVFSQLNAGDMILLGARPGHGKTLLGLEILTHASAIGKTGFFFTLDYQERDVSERLLDLGFDQSSCENTIVIDTSDEISADYIVNSLKKFDGPAVVVIDYLQLLDQKRTNPNLDDQLKLLNRYVKDTGTVCAVISQVDRSFDLSSKSMPDRSDIRLPNPLDLSLFDKICFLNDGKIQLDTAA